MLADLSSSSSSSLSLSLSLPLSLSLSLSPHLLFNLSSFVLHLVIRRLLGGVIINHLLLWSVIWAVGFSLSFLLSFSYIPIMSKRITIVHYAFYSVFCLLCHSRLSFRSKLTFPYHFFCNHFFRQALTIALLSLLDATVPSENVDTPTRSSGFVAGVSGKPPRRRCVLSK